MLNRIADLFLTYADTNQIFLLLHRYRSAAVSVLHIALTNKNSMNL